ncbi:hypothetical protein MP228_013092 [Amoeboaphelidium protococcarum]|nr:hypothetical protein MP228_013092 [Amoeboaphelidium protococcarum]
MVRQFKMLMLMFLVITLNEITNVHAVNPLMKCFGKSQCVQSVLPAVDVIAATRAKSITLFYHEKCMRWPVEQEITFNFALRLYQLPVYTERVQLDNVRVAPQEDIDTQYSERQLQQWSVRGYPANQLGDMQWTPGTIDYSPLEIKSVSAKLIQSERKIVFNTRLYINKDIKTLDPKYLVLNFKVFYKEQDVYKESILSVIVLSSKFSVCIPAKWNTLSSKVVFNPSSQEIRDQERRLIEYKERIATDIVKHCQLDQETIQAFQDSKCVICQEAMLDGSDLAIPKCGIVHSAHASCIREWCFVKSICPYCKKTMWYKET